MQKTKQTVTSGSEPERAFGFPSHLEVAHFNTVNKMHLGQTAALSGNGSWDDKEKRGKKRDFQLPVCWSLLCFSCALKLPLDVFISCLVLKIEKVLQ